MLAPLIVQSNGVILLELGSPTSIAARNALIRFSELEKSPEHVHTYRLTPLSIWNAAEIGLTADQIIEQLQHYSRYPIPANLIEYVNDIYSRYGQLKLFFDTEDRLLLEVEDRHCWQLLKAHRKLAKFLSPAGENAFYLPRLQRGNLKIELIRLGYPISDLVPLKEGQHLAISLRKKTRSGTDLVLRDYQLAAVNALLGDGQGGSGFGSIVLPCGAGKTIVGMALISRLQCETLILVPNNSAAEQWQREILDKTNIDDEHCQLYSRQQKRVAALTIVTYQMLTWRASKTDDFRHFSIFSSRNWGLIIYDEVHLLPAPVFRFVAELQALRRVGLSGTLVREDGQEDVVFSLIGPKRYDVPWREMEQDGWIAKASCHEIRLELPQEQRLAYALASNRDKSRLAAENQRKDDCVEKLLQRHPQRKILIIGQYIRQLERLAKRLALPMLSGKTPNIQREELYQQFREGKQRILVVSKIGNCAIDLPDASIAIQLSGSFGSRQEEAQRLGRILRPKEEIAIFYSLISRHTVEEDYAMRRRQFLLEQGYSYSVDVLNE